MKKYDIVNKNKLTFLLPIISVFAVFLFSGCWNSSHNKSELVVINVLDKKYYDDCHIKGSINIPFEELEKKVKTLNKKNTYVFYCSNYACTAAPFSANLFKEEGFEKVYVYHGGIVEWYSKNYPYNGPAKLSYLKDKNEQLDDDNHDDVSVITAENLKLQMEQQELLN